MEIRIYSLVEGKTIATVDAQFVPRHGEVVVGIGYDGKDFTGIVRCVEHDFRNNGVIPVKVEIV